MLQRLNIATRGVLVTIANETDYTFVRTKYLVPHGIWREEPPGATELFECNIHSIVYRNDSATCTARVWH